jgi:UDP-N-acetylmuramate dehydrogenase
VIVQINKSLKTLNTFGIDQQAERLIWAQSKNEVLDYLSHHGAPALVLGGGSNMLLTKDVQGDVLKIDIQGREVIFENDEVVHLRLGAGENWHEIVLWSLSQGFGGMENLSLIPGNCGTAPVQNIGAYGVELKDILLSVEGVQLEPAQPFELDAEGCQFGYRDSIFKNLWKGKAIITHITVVLTKVNHKLHMEYGAIKSELDAANIDAPTPRDISDAVIKIRQSKLPDPAVLGNSGSFFKNPIVSEETAKSLLEKYEDMPTYSVKGGMKLAAGWLIEKAGWKGFRRGDAGVHEKQALVLVNYGNATGDDVLTLAKDIIADVAKKYDVQLQAEVNLI